MSQKDCMRRYRQNHKAEISLYQQAYRARNASRQYDAHARDWQMINGPTDLFWHEANAWRAGRDMGLTSKQALAWVRENVQPLTVEEIIRFNRQK